MKPLKLLDWLEVSTNHGKDKAMLYANIQNDSQLHGF